MSENFEVNDSTTDQEDQPPPPAGKELLFNLLFNIVIPVVILSYFSKPQYLGIKTGLVVALAFPILYGAKDFFQSGKINWFSVIGVVTLLLTGGMGLLEIPPKYIAIKEAAVPGLIGLAVLYSLRTRYPLVKTIIFKNPLIKTNLVNRALKENNSTAEFDKSLRNSSLILAGSFFLSACTNYILAIVVLKSTPGSEAFNEELGRMIALSYPVNVLPASIIMVVALFYTVKSIEKNTHLKFEEILNLPMIDAEQNDKDNPQLSTKDNDTK